MGLKCKKCGSRNTQTVKAKDLAKASGDASFLSSASGYAASGAAITTLLTSVSNAITAFFEWLSESEKNDRNVVACKSCGYWERV